MKKLILGLLLLTACTPEPVLPVESSRMDGEFQVGTLFLEEDSFCYKEGYVDNSNVVYTSQSCEPVSDFSEQLERIHAEYQEKHYIARMRVFVSPGVSVSHYKERFSEVVFYQVRPQEPLPIALHKHYWKAWFKGNL